MESSSPRQLKVARLIQKELAVLLQKMSKEHIPGTLLSVSSVRVSPDFALAKIYVSIFPVDKTKVTMEFLSLSNKEIRFRLGNLIRNQVRHIPELAFFIDDSLDYIENIDRLLKND